MRTTFTLPVLMVVLLVMQSCSKSDQQEMVLSPSADQHVTAVISSNEAYEFALDETESIVISRQASHYTESFTGVDEKTGNFRYKYIPALNYKGTDEVTLKSTKTVTGYMTGSGCNYDSDSEGRTTNNIVTKYLTIKFTIN